MTLTDLHHRSALDRLGDAAWSVWTAAMGVLGWAFAIGTVVGLWVEMIG